MGKKPQRRLTSEEFKREIGPGYPNAYGWWRMGRAPDEDDSIEAWYEDIRQKFGQSAADTHCRPLLEVARKIRGR